ncbi:MAG: helix-turn-helix transcriptional regulator [Deltaproteobacteria bacterium]|nr:helix-turn-helix transcriptional regulator [Deltaproteobacteria bacterium]
MHVKENFKYNNIKEKFNIGPRIKELRGKEARHLFAKRFDMSINTLIKYENSEGVPDILVLMLIADHYGVSFYWLVFGNTDKYSHNNSQLEATFEKSQISDSQIFTNQISAVLSIEKLSEFKTISDFLVSLSFEDFSDLWDRYRCSSEALKGWLQVEIIKRFPEFQKWIENSLPFPTKNKEEDPPLIGGINQINL